MTRIIIALFGAIILCTSAAYAEEVSAEKVCASKGHTFVVDRCFTGKTCTMNNGAQGYEAEKNGRRGCSRTPPEYTEEMREKMKDPEAVAQGCVASGKWWSQDRCFNGRRCRYTDGSEGYEAFKDGVTGCSQFGPRNWQPRQASGEVRRKTNPKQ